MITLPALSVLMVMISNLMAPVNSPVLLIPTALAVTKLATLIFVTPEIKTVTLVTIMIVASVNSPALVVLTV
jgi:hypothetical protein